MTLATIKTTAMKGFNAVKHFTSKNSPEILLGLGIASMIGGTVLACRGARHLDGILVDAYDRKEEAALKSYDEADDKDIKAVEETYDMDVVPTTEIGWALMTRTEKAKLQLQTIGEVAMEFAPAALCMIGGISMIIGSHNIMTKRNAALMAAYTGINEAYNKYRNRVIERYGEEADYEIRNDVKKGTQKVETVDEATGKKKKSDEEFDYIADPSLYSRWFDESCPEWSKAPGMNYHFLMCQQNYLNDKLVMRASESPKGIGHVFLNEVYEAIGIPHTGPGSLVGWLYDMNDPDRREFIDFGMHEAHNEAKRAFVNGYERSILLDFNVKEIIYDKI